MKRKGDLRDPQSVRDLVEKNPPSVGPSDRLARVASVLSRTRLNAVIVARNGRLAGCIHRRSLLKPPVSAETKAERLIFQPPTVSPSNRPQDAVALLIQSKMDFLPVLQGTRLVGTVLARDLAVINGPDGILEDLSDALVPPLDKDASISEAAAVLREKDLYSVPVVEEDGELVGWASFPDVFRYILAPTDAMTIGEFKGEREKPLRNPVAPISSQTGVLADSSESIKSGLRKMQAADLNELTVVEDGAVLGHLSVLAILSLSQPATTMAVDISGAEEEDPLVVSLIAKNATALFAKLSRVWPRLRPPHLKIKSYEHELSKRKRYHVTVVFQTPERFVAEAEGWDLMTVANSALKKVEREMLKGKSRLIESHRRKGAYIGEQ